jgi:site-specific DNA recombinase
MHMTSVIYARQSRDKDGDGTALDRQLIACRKLAEARELEVVAEIVENDTSATKGTRPGYERLIAGIVAGDYKTVIVWHTDRLYRRVRDLLTLMEVALAHDVSVMTVKAGDIDLASPIGRMFANMTAGVAQYEVEHKAERQIAANMQRAEKGVWQFSRRPYGYERVAGEVVIVEDEAAVIREAYARYLSGESYYSIAQGLNAEGALTSTGREWSVSTLRALLRNPGYAGILVYKGLERGDGNWEPIISRSTWAQYKQMRTRRKVPHDWANQAKHLLSGLAVCGVCGGRLFARPMYGRGTAQKAVTLAYACRDKWCVQRNLDRLDDLVSRVIVARFSQPDAVAEIRASRSLVEDDSELDELRARWDDLASLAADGTLRPQAVREQSAVLRDKIEKLEARIMAARQVSVASDLAIAEDIAGYWDAMPLPRKRALIQYLMVITVNKQANPRRFDPNDVVISWVSPD